MRLLPMFCLFFMLVSSAGLRAMWPPNTQTDRDTVTQIVQTLAADSLQGRAPASKGSKASITYLENWLAEQGFIPAGKKKGSFRQTFKGGTNLLALWHPQDAAQKAPHVLVMAHFDHLASGCAPHVSAGSTVCNGAADNAAGVAAALLAAQRLRDANQMPFALLLSDGEESGLAGSRAFVKKPGIDLSQVALVINLDIVGLDLFKGLEKHHLVFGIDQLPASLQGPIKQRLAGFDLLQLQYFSYGLSHNRSDHTSFMTAKKPIPSLLLTDGSGGPYHSAADELRHLNLEKVVAVAQLASDIALASRETDSPRENVSKAPLSPSFSDTQALHTLLSDVFAQRKLNGLYGVQLAKIRKHMALLNRMQQAGEAAFGSTQAQQLGGIARDFLQLSRECFFQNVTSEKK